MIALFCQKNEGIFVSISLILSLFPIKFKTLKMGSNFKAGWRRGRARPFLYLSYIHLGSSVCLSSCHIPVVLSYLRNALLFF